MSLSRAARTPDASSVLALLVAGPVGWMAWNFHAHGSATHFLTRVAAYRHALGVGFEPLFVKLARYPLALLEGAPDVTVAAAVGLFALARFPSMRARWSGPLLATLMLLAFLTYGDLRDGAPTHHTERALVAAWWVLAPFGVEGVVQLVSHRTFGRSGREAWAVAFAVAAGMTWASRVVASWEDYPARSDEEQRDAQIARGRVLRKSAPERLDVTPCAYEHFALLAAFGAPERANVHPPTRTPVTRACPRVDAP